MELVPCSRISLITFIYPSARLPAFLLPEISQKREINEGLHACFKGLIVWYVSEKLVRLFKGRFVCNWHSTHILRGAPLDSILHPAFVRAFCNEPLDLEQAFLQQRSIIVLSELTEKDDELGFGSSFFHQLRIDSSVRDLLSESHWNNRVPSPSFDLNKPSCCERTLILSGSITIYLKLNLSVLVSAMTLILKMKGPPKLRSLSCFLEDVCFQSLGFPYGPNWVEGKGLLVVGNKNIIDDWWQTRSRSWEAHHRRDNGQDDEDGNSCHWKNLHFIQADLKVNGLFS